MSSNSSSSEYNKQLVYSADGVTAEDQEALFELAHEFFLSCHLRENDAFITKQRQAVKRLHPLGVMPERSFLPALKEAYGRCSLCCNLYCLSRQNSLAVAPRQRGILSLRFYHSERYIYFIRSLGDSSSF
jgi:hypothetical protein